MKRNTRKIRPADPETPAQTDPVREPRAVQPTHPVLDAVSEVLHRRDVCHAVMTNGHSLMFSMVHEGLAWTTTVKVLDEKAMLRLAACLPLSVPAAKRQDVAAFLTRLNYGNLIGSWQMDFKDGHVCYVSTHLYGDKIPDDKEIRILEMITNTLMSREGPQILRRMQGRAGKLVLPPEPQRN